MKIKGTEHKVLYQFKIEYKYLVYFYFGQTTQQTTTNYQQFKNIKIMKATNNTDTLFMDIFVELFAIAKVYFQELFKNAAPGTYTIKDIYSFIEKNIETTKEGKLTNVNPYFSDRYEKILEKSPYYSNIDTFNKYTISYLCRVNGDIISIEKGNFKCSFDIVKVFEYLERFKKLSGAKDKLEFTKETEIKEGQKTTFFEVELSEKDIKSLISVKTEKKDIVNRYTENTVHLSLTDSMMYATNCFVLKAKKLMLKNVLGETKDILIPFDVLKNIGAGNCEFTVIEDKEMYKVVVKNTATDKVVSYSFEKIEKFFNYKSIYPELYKEMNVSLKDVKPFADRIKTQQKACKNFGLVYFMIQVIKGSKEIKVVTCNEAYNIDNDYKFSEFSFELKESSEFSGNYFYRFNDVLKCLDDWNGNLYFDEIKLSFETKAVDTCFCISVQDSDKYFDKYSIVAIKPDKLTKIEIDAISEQSNNNVSLDNCGKEKDKTKQTERNNSVQPKETKPIVQYTDDMLELVSLDLDSMTYTVNGDIGTEKGIASIVLYDKIGKIVVFFNDGEKRECQFDGESILQSILKEM